MLVSAFRASVVSQGDRMAVGLVCRAHRNKSKQPRFRDSFAFRGSGIAGEVFGGHTLIPSRKAAKHDDIQA